MTAEQLQHYIKQCKIHEENHVNTNDRNAYWESYFEKENYDFVSKLQTAHRRQIDLSLVVTLLATFGHPFSCPDRRILRAPGP